MNPLTPEQKDRAVELLENIVRPGTEIEDDERMFRALDEASKLFGYWKPAATVGRGPRKAYQKRTVSQPPIRRRHMRRKRGLHTP